VARFWSFCWGGIGRLPRVGLRVRSLGGGGVGGLQWPSSRVPVASRVWLPGAALIEAIRGGCARRSMTGIAEVGPDRGPLRGSSHRSRF